MVKHKFESDLADYKISRVSKIAYMYIMHNMLDSSSSFQRGWGASWDSEMGKNKKPLLPSKKMQDWRKPKTKIMWTLNVTRGIRWEQEWQLIYCRAENVYEAVFFSPLPPPPLLFLLFLRLLLLFLLLPLLLDFWLSRLIFFSLPE